MTVEYLLTSLLLVLVLLSIDSLAERQTYPLIGTKFANTTIYAAMIMTDPMVAAVLGRDFHRVPQGVNGSATQNAEWRLKNGINTAKELPFHVEFW